MAKTRIAELLARHQSDLLAEWLKVQTEGSARLGERLSAPQLKSTSQEFLRALADCVSSGGSVDITAPRWSKVRDVLADISRDRAVQGFTPGETATFVFSLKKPLFSLLRTEFAGDEQALAEETWAATELLDTLGLYTTELYQKTREEVIARQQQEMLELSTPVVELWEGILALPLIGTLDSARTQIVMQNLLEAIVAKSADLAIVDITGVATVDTLVAQHLLKTVAAARLMGAECIISGIRPQIAQTIIHLGVDLGGVVTKATLSDAFQLALKRKNLTLAPRS